MMRLFLAIALSLLAISSNAYVLSTDDKNNTSRSGSYAHANQSYKSSPAGTPLPESNYKMQKRVKPQKVPSMMVLDKKNDNANKTQATASAESSNNSLNQGTAASQTMQNVQSSAQKITGQNATSTSQTQSTSSHITANDATSGAASQATQNIQKSVPQTTVQNDTSSNSVSTQNKPSIPHIPSVAQTTVTFDQPQYEKVPVNGAPAGYSNQQTNK